MNASSSILTLLVVDDPDDAAILAGILDSAPGFSLIKRVRTGEEALNYLESIEVGLLVIDQFLPGMTGIDLLMQVRSMGLEVDAVLISSVAERGNVQLALRYGAVDYLVKPVMPERFSFTLKRIREKAGLMSERENLDQKGLDALFHPAIGANSSLIPETTILPSGGHSYDATNIGLQAETDQVTKGVTCHRLTGQDYKLNVFMPDEGIFGVPSKRTPLETAFSIIDEVPVLPKGVDRETLGTILKALYKLGGEYSTQEVAAYVGISRITVRKYLDYLKDRNILSGRLEYRSNGRPVTIFKLFPNLSN